MMYHCFLIIVFIYAKNEVALYEIFQLNDSFKFNYL